MTERVGGWLGDRLPDTMRGRFQLGQSSVLVLVVVGVLAAFVSWLAWQNMGGEVQQVKERKPQLTISSPSVAETTGVAPGSEAKTEVVVDVVGKVRNPGVVTLAAGSRVVDAIAKAGGAKPGVSLSGLNRARVLVDGEQIYVGKPPGGVAGAAVLAPGAPAGANLISLNTATQEQLETLPGVGPVTAQSILQWRASHGSFSAIDELLEVDGIGEKTLAKLAPFLTL